MRRYRTEIDNVRAHLRSLWVVIGAQFIVILALGLLYAWRKGLRFAVGTRLIWTEKTAP